MADFYRKKRRKAGPNKNQEKVQRGLDAEAQAHAAGTLSSRFPTARALKVRIAITSPQNVVLEQSDRRIGPNDPFQLRVDCPGRCGSGSFDFAELVGQCLARAEARGLVQTACVQPLYGGGPEACGCAAKCEFEAELAPG